MVSTIPPSSTDGRSLLYHQASIHTPLQILASYNPNDQVDTPGWAGATGVYFGGSPYQGDDAEDSRAIPVLGRTNHAVQVVSAQTTSYSVQVEGSLDGNTWATLEAPWTTDGLYNFPALVKFIRFNITALTLTGGYSTTQPYGLRITYMAIAE